MRAISMMGVTGLLLTAVPAVAQDAQSKLCSTLDDGSNEPTLTSESDVRTMVATIGTADCWVADVGNDKHFYLNDLYARWTIAQVDHGKSPLVRDYRSETPSFIDRLFIGRTRSSVVTVKIKMLEPDIEFTVPLLTIDYNGKIGQRRSFVTTLISSTMSLTDFRLSPNSSVEIEANSRITSETDVHVTGVVLGALGNALSIAAPGSSLLTSVNREQVKNLSAAYDSALSNLFSRTIAESTTTGRLLSEWYPGSSMLVSVDIADAVRTKGDRGPDGKPLATPRRLWFRLTLTCPRPSIFDTANVCEIGNADDRNLRALINSPNRKDGRPTKPELIVGRPGFESEQYKALVSQLAERISSHQVLNFRMGSGKSLRQFLTEQEWFISLSKKMVQPKPKVVENASKVAVSSETLEKPSPESQGIKADTDQQDLTSGINAADEFCEAVVEKLYSAGLSHLDSEIGLWAVASGIPDFAPSRSIFSAAPGCVAHLPGKQWKFSEASKPAKK